jgi:hypothetical protein
MVAVWVSAVVLAACVCAQSFQFSHALCGHATVPRARGGGFLAWTAAGLCSAHRCGRPWGQAAPWHVLLHHSISCSLPRQSSMQELLLRVLSKCPARSGCGQGGVPEHLGEAIWMCTPRHTSEAVWRRKAVQRTVQVSLGTGVRVSCAHSRLGAHMGDCNILLALGVLRCGVPVLNRWHAR